MTGQEYISSGILELYVAGTLSEKENLEIYEAMQKYPAVLEEVMKIESAVVQLTASTAPFSSKFLFDQVSNQLIKEQSGTININRSKWVSYIGWAASVIIGGLFLWTLFQNDQLKNSLEAAEANRDLIENEIEKARTDLIEADELISVLRTKDIITVPLEAQPAFPDAFAQVYWDKKTNSVYLDALNLPNPPDGMVYQLWSLKLNPLTPTSLGVVDGFALSRNKIFLKKNIYESEAFGITLEPAGGSETPTMEALYSLGVVKTS